MVNSANNDQLSQLGETNAGPCLKYYNHEANLLYKTKVVILFYALPMFKAV